ncbi:MAG: LysR family transcriptional regulator [Rhodospirillales bacterium]|nr:LysR family transcriptional regulator [Rhodospirillales bacterium]MDE2574576.1 LysR family transcriptional regulator [Rhodospirillales bacterium]
MWSEIPNLRHLRAFAVVAESPSISRAAQQIHLSQPAVSQAMLKLEARIGVRLLEAGSAGKGPTPAGRLFHDRVRRALDRLAQGRQEALAAEPRKAAGGFARFDEMVSAAQLRALSAVAMAGNFSLAAREVGLAQPSIHRAARDLERISGLALFAPTPQGIVLTRAGEALARNASLALAELHQGLTEMGETLGRDAAQIVIGSLPLARARLLPEAINRLARERPRTSVRVIAAPYDGMLHRLRHGIIDFLIGALRDPLPIGDIVQQTLFEDTLAVIARPGHPLARRGSVTQDDLAAFPWVVPVEETPTRAIFNRIFPPADVARMPGGIVETSSHTLLRGLLAGSDRLTILSTRQVADDLERGLLIALKAELPWAHRPIGLTFRQGWRPTATQAALLGHIRAVSGTGL